MKKILIWPEMHEAVRAAVTEFGIPRDTVLEPAARNRGVKMYGEAYARPPRIRIRVHRYGRPNQPFAPGTVFATLAHEIAHLVPGAYEHGRVHSRTTWAVAAWLRRRGLPVSTSVFCGAFRKRKGK